MIKDLLASMNDIYSDSNLNLKEKSILMYLIKQFNIKYNYAYPKYEDIMSATGIGRRANVADAIKSLVIKGYITVKKTIGNKSHYFIEKYLHFVGEKAQEVDSDEKVNSNKTSVEEIKVETKDNSIKPFVVSDYKESGLQMTIEDVEKVEIMTPEERKVHDQFNNASVRIARKYTSVDGNSYAISILSCLDSQIVKEAGYRFKNQLELGKLKLNCVSNFLRVVVDKYFEKGIDFPTKAFNMLKKYNYVTCQPSDSKLAMISEESEMYMNTEETSEEYVERINRELGLSDRVIGGTECVIGDMTESLDFNGIMIGA